MIGIDTVGFQNMLTTNNIRRKLKILNHAKDIENNIKAIREYDILSQHFINEWKLIKRKELMD